MDKLLYNKDVLVAEIDGLNHFHWICKRRAPLYLQITENLSVWLQSRCVDFQRHNAKLLKRALGLSAMNEEEVVLEVNAGNDNRYILDQEGRFWIDLGTGGFSEGGVFGSGIGWR